jgi:hypothetical protein
MEVTLFRGVRFCSLSSFCLPCSFDQPSAPRFSPALRNLWASHLGRWCWTHSLPVLAPCAFPFSCLLPLPALSPPVTISLTLHSRRSMIPSSVSPPSIFLCPSLLTPSAACPSPSAAPSPAPLVSTHFSSSSLIPLHIIVPRAPP